MTVCKKRASPHKPEAADLLADISSSDLKIDEMEIEIEKECLKIQGA